jgi:ribonuclease BN (tRNA processing enzyme)
MILTVIGCYGPYPAAGQCCSGYLVQDSGTAVLLDCGNGVLSRLRYYLEPWELSAVVVSHLHSDHICDLLIMRYALMIRQMQEGGKALKVFAPAEPENDFRQLTYKDALTAVPLGESSRLQIGSLRFSFHRGHHAIPSFLITIECEGKKIVYSGDTEYFPGMAKVVEGADLFLCEANYLRADLEKGYRNHLAAFQAAEAALSGQVKRLVLTHLHPDRDRKAILSEAGELFPRVELASAGSLYNL